MYTKINTPIDRALRDTIVAQLTAKGYDGADRLPESFTLDDIYRLYDCQNGDPAAPMREHGIYSIVDEAMNSTIDGLTDPMSHIGGGHAIPGQETGRSGSYE